MSDLTEALDRLRTLAYQVGNDNPSLLANMLDRMDAVDALIARRPGPHIRTALDYTPLVGKVIRMERPASPGERAAGEPGTYGMECLVAEISDIDVGVLIVSDEGLAMLIRPDEQDAWRFTVWPDAATRGLFAAYRP